MADVLNFKCLLIGDSFCGKTTFIRQFVKDDDLKECLFDKNAAPITFGTNLGPICFNVFEVDPLLAFRDAFYQNAHCAIILFDVSSPSSFDNVLHWYRKVTILNSKNIPIALCANKIDIKTRKVMSDEIKSLWGSRLRSFELSAKTNRNILQPFFFLTEKLLNSGTIIDMSRIGTELSVSLESLHKMIEEEKVKNRSVIE